MNGKEIDGKIIGRGIIAAETNGGGNKRKD